MKKRNEHSVSITNCTFQANAAAVDAQFVPVFAELAKAVAANAAAVSAIADALKGVPATMGTGITVNPPAEEA